MAIFAKVIADSVWDGNRITTMHLRYPRFIHAQVMTYRLWARNARSSRAVPSKTLIREVLDDPALPLHWGQNQRGMQAGPLLSPLRTKLAQGLYKALRYPAVWVVLALHKIGLHKQTANRLLEPWMWIDVLITSTDKSQGKKPWDNFFAQRIHDDAQPEIQILASAMKTALAQSTPIETRYHTPYHEGRETSEVSIEEGQLLSAARCARISYRPWGAMTVDRDADKRLAMRLENSGHWSPFEHVAEAKDGQHGVLYGWQSLRDKKGA